MQLLAILYCSELAISYHKHAAHLCKRRRHPLCVDSCVFQSLGWGRERAQAQDQCTERCQGRWDLVPDQSELYNGQKHAYEFQYIPYHWTYFTVLQSIRGDGITISQHSADNASIRETPVVITDSAPRPVVQNLHCSLNCGTHCSIHHQPHRVLECGIGSCVCERIYISIKQWNAISEIL